MLMRLLQQTALDYEVIGGGGSLARAAVENRFHSYSLRVAETYRKGRMSEINTSGEGVIMLGRDHKSKILTILYAHRGMPFI
jgi:hypothetical protein